MVSSYFATFLAEQEKHSLTGTDYKQMNPLLATVAGGFFLSHTSESSAHFRLRCKWI
jgi:hypothetical protein